jgi:hypothetical protein
MYHDFLKENAMTELLDLQLNLDDYETPKQVAREIKHLEETRKATRLINYMLWCIIAIIALPCVVSIVQEFADRAPMYTDAAIKGCLASLLGFTTMLFYYQDKKNKLDRKLFMLNMLIANPTSSSLPSIPVVLEQ